jgi:hypothetical protein
MNLFYVIFLYVFDQTMNWKKNDGKSYIYIAWLINIKLSSILVQIVHLQLICLIFLFLEEVQFVLDYEWITWIITQVHSLSGINILKHGNIFVWCHVLWNTITTYHELSLISAKKDEQSNNFVSIEIELFVCPFVCSIVNFFLEFWIWCPTNLQ